MSKRIQAMMINAGNSRVVVTDWTGTANAPRFPSGREDLMGAAPLHELSSMDSGLIYNDINKITGNIHQLHEQAGRPPMVLVSVMPDLVAGMVEQFSELTVIDHRCPLPYEVRITRPEQIGPDRLCNVAAAVAAGLQDALIVDAGTATTFDLLLGGAFAGGFIAPGMAFAAASLGERAARLEPVGFGPAPMEVGTDTATAMAGGAWHCGIGGVQHVIRGLLAHYGERPVILTGGLGRHLVQEGRYHDSWWTLRGAAHLAGLI